MTKMRVLVASVELLEEAFEDVAASWGLSHAERDAVRGAAVPPRRRPHRSRFVTDRMGLVVEIDCLLRLRMERREIRKWLRCRVAGVFGSSPVEDMFGSTDRLRRIRTLLELDCTR